MAARIRDSSVLLLSLLSLFLSFYLYFYHDKKERRPRRIAIPVRAPYFHLIIEIEVSFTRSLCSKFFPRHDRTHVETSPRLTIFTSGPRSSPDFSGFGDFFFRTGLPRRGNGGLLSSFKGRRSNERATMSYFYFRNFVDIVAGNALFQ